ncbi:MAG: hypothetical protein J6Y04_01125, partial [Bacteroidaceae bacterium]|nr:hypothetical protein [Bacteroidaceae bacterium]
CNHIVRIKRRAENCAQCAMRKCAILQNLSGALLCGADFFVSLSANKRERQKSMASFNRK